MIDRGTMRLIYCVIFKVYFWFKKAVIIILLALQDSNIEDTQSFCIFDIIDINFIFMANCIDYSINVVNKEQKVMYI